MKYDVIIIGSGFAGATLARKFAENNQKVLILEKRNHIGGNMYEEVLENGIRIHKYGPHIFHTNSDRVFEFLRQFGDWYFYEHRVLGKINDKLVPIPFNFKSLEILYNQKEASMLKEKLLKKYPDQKKISILDLINDQDKEIQKLGRFIYKNVFENYTAKQWNMPISQIDTSVINRVPVILDYDDRYFQDKIQYMPKDGYTEIFNNMLNHPNITVELSTNALDKLTVKGNKIYYLQQEFTNPVIYSGAIDELFSYQYGALPYRSLKLDFETKNMNYYQPVSVVNYPNEEKFTRITEFKYFSNCPLSSSTTILKEYPQNYDHKNEKTIPYYTIQNEENLKLYHQYLNQANKIPNLYLCGRLAEYKYYNMDAVIERALDLYETIFEKTHK